jgi:Peptidase C39 family
LSYDISQSFLAARGFILILNVKDGVAIVTGKTGTFGKQQHLQMTATRVSSISRCLLVFACFTTIAAPTIFNIVTTPKALPNRFDGKRYQLAWTGVTAQQHDNTCSLAVISNMLEWVGRPVNEGVLQKNAKLTTKGMNLLEFSKLAAKYGLYGDWVSAEPNSLPDLPMPFVAQIQDGVGHFVIVKRVYNHHVYVADPLRGNNLYPEDQFNKVWTKRSFLLRSL